MFACTINTINHVDIAAGVISFLEEDDDHLKVRALQKIYQVIDIHWAEICESLPIIEALSEDTSFPAHDLAAAIASKCFYHLQELNDSLRLALSAGKYFDVSGKNEYIETILSHCIDQYKSLKSQQLKEKEGIVEIDPRMEFIIEQMFQRCYRDTCLEQALGVALDTHRIDKVEEVISEAIKADKDHILGYAFSLCQSARNVTPREFRLSVIEVLVKYYGQLRDPDYSNVVFGLQYLNRPEDAAQTLEKLLRGTMTESLLAYQIAFDLLETENQGFILKVIAELSASNPSGAEGAAASSSADPDYEQRLNKLKRVLLEGLDVDLTLNFLFKNSHTDMGLLKDIKQMIEGKCNVLHNSTVIAHSFLQAGSTIDTFLRDNLDWLGKAKNWAKFTAIGSMGVVHKGHIHQSMALLQPYLPQGGESSSPYSESGALYALGLIHANKGGNGDSATIKFLSDALRNCGNNEIVQHGACLGIGLAAMATGDAELFDALRSILFADSAVGGEGAAFGIGLLLLGQCDSDLAQMALPDLLNYLHDTSHEKIIRALSLAIAMMVYGKEESADVIIEQMMRDRDPIVRYGAMFAIAMAYCGTSDNVSLRKLLHVAVSDVSDDVRRAAVMSIGFLMFRNPETVPKLVALLAESFNPHVRYGACLAVGVACAGTALKDAMDILNPLLEDAVDFVRQGAMLSMAMVLQQTSEARSPSVKRFRDQCLQVIGDKHQPVPAKSGAILALGILESGGGNMAISMVSRAGFLKMAGTVGLIMFLQYWYWYPLMPFFSLALSPTALIALNGNFDMPTSFNLQCNAPPSMFAYHKQEEKKEEDKKPIATAVLSTTAKARAREARKEAKKLGLARQPSVDSVTMPGSIPLERVASHMSTVSYISLDTEAKPPVDTKPKKAKEPTSFTVTNPSRVVPSQVRFLSQSSEQRYRPVRNTAVLSGIIILNDDEPELPEEVLKVEKISLGQTEIAPTFEPFEWDPNEDN
jgi:26S proteasome regulatory subunit N2